ncbi:MAG: GNAT family N-acetyltransferase [Propionibacteriaceae bacterium]|nr:GNAT family N-acetyltransferase [Propionibacteriaceae bacterium]
MFKQLSDVSTLRGLAGFEFDWTARSNDQTITVARIENGEIAGLAEFERLPHDLFDFLHLIEVAPEYRGTEVAGKLLAYVARDSFERDFDGFVVFEPKTLLYQYYIEKYGAKPLPGRRLHFDSLASQVLIERYLGDE